MNISYKVTLMDKVFTNILRTLLIKGDILENLAISIC